MPENRCLEGNTEEEEEKVEEEKEEEESHRQAEGTDRPDRLDKDAL